MNWTDLPFFTSDLYTSIADRLTEDMNSGLVVLPTVSNIMRALDKTPFDSVKCIILGQDPYPTQGHANGLAFSVNKNVSPLPKSLQNIYKELEADVGVTRGNGDLTDWAEQGVLLLNTTLTVLEGKAGSHSKIGWSTLTDEIIDALNERKDGLVFILWGKHAQTKERKIDTTKHLVLKSPHPSPLSAHRGFFGSRPFSKTNTYLQERQNTLIDW